MCADISCRRGCRSTVVQQLNDVVTLLDDVVDLYNDLYKDRKCLQTFFVVRVSFNSSTMSFSCRRIAQRRRSTTRRHPQRHRMTEDIFVSLCSDVVVNSATTTRGLRMISPALPTSRWTKLKYAIAY